MSEQDGHMPVLEQDEISLVELVKLFWARRRLLMYFMIVSTLIGLGFTFLSRDEYTATSKLLSEESQLSNSKGLAGLAGLAGINIEDQNNSSLPDHSVIVQSQPFLLDLLKEEVYSAEFGKRLTLQDYLIAWAHKGGSATFVRNGRSIFFDKSEPKEKPRSSRDSVHNKGILVLTGSQNSGLKDLKNRIIVTTEDKFVTLSVKMPEGLVSAEVNQIVKEKLIEYIVSYKTIKRKRNVEFLEVRTAEARKNFQEAQLRLAGFQDRNLGLIVQSGRAKETQLQAQYNLYFNLYSSLASQLEQARIKLKEETPVFTEFEPVTMPKAPSGPNRVVVVLAFAIAGFMAGVIFIFGILVKEAFVSAPKRE